MARHSELKGHKHLAEIKRENSPEHKVKYKSLRTSPGKMTSGKPIFLAMGTFVCSKRGKSSLICLISPCRTSTVTAIRESIFPMSLLAINLRNAPSRLSFSQSINGISKLPLKSSGLLIMGIVFVSKISPLSSRTTISRPKRLLPVSICEVAVTFTLRISSTGKLPDISKARLLFKALIFERIL
uniref:Uncharacterized protein n=1 Tax=Glossina palpalis gambiensis TaxID=67801 RepID=A0A1B0BKY0_9MUSC